MTPPLKVPHGESGIIVDVKVFTREAGDELGPGVNMVVRVYIAQKRKISVGDKMADRHGNKGRGVPDHAPGGYALPPRRHPPGHRSEPLGVPSRMNIGQVLKSTWATAAQALGWKVATPSSTAPTRKTLWSCWPRQACSGGLSQRDHRR